MSLLQIATGASVSLSEIKPEEAGIALLILGVIGFGALVLNRLRIARLAQRERSNFDVHSVLAGRGDQRKGK